MKGITILVTGSTDGIGKETAIELAKKNANVIVHGRSEQRVKNTIAEIVEKSGNKYIHSVVADFSSLEQVSQMAKQLTDDFDKIDVLINNAGLLSNKKVITEDKLELTFQVNHIAGFLLTNKLLPLLKNAENARIINVSSMIHASDIDFDNLQGEKNYSGSGNYALSKLCNILHIYKLAEILDKTNVTANCLHPGVIDTKLLNSAWSGGFPVSEGARVLMYAAESPVLEQTSGLYLENNRPMQSNPVSYNKENQDKLWNLSEKLVSAFI